MLVLSRKVDDGIVIGDNVVIRVLGVKGNQVRIGIDAPRDVKVNRAEVLENEQAANADAQDLSETA